MIFDRRDADAQNFVDFTVAQFIDPVHQKNPPGLPWHGIDSFLIESEEVGGLDIPFLLGSGSAVTVLAKREERDGSGALAPRAVDQQILRDTAQESPRIDEPMALFASRCAREDLLHQVGRLLGAGPSSQEMEQRCAVVPEDFVEIGPATDGRI